MNSPDWSFQEDAIKSIVNDFEENPTSKNLLVIPTGGGKTITAIRSINSLIKSNFLGTNNKVIWITHLKQLKKQTIDVMRNNENKKKFKFHKDLLKVVEIRMKSSARKMLRKNNSEKYKLIIIDEAHHSAAKTYKDFFRPNIGVLGLTATPTRTDENDLEFDKISYSISFRELIKRNVLILPKFKTVNTQKTITATNLEQNEQLNKFNTEARNQFIADSIFKNKEKFKKIVIFVGTKSHGKNLYKIIKRKNEYFGSPYMHVGFIFGGNQNEKKIDNDSYLNDHKKINSSILITCKILGEGYDDPSLNTVVIAVPTRSILFYMQSVGRIVRTYKIPNTDEKYVLEVVDNLPNIKYRINNRWLFADISDYLQPMVLDIDCYDIEDFNEKIKSIFNEHNVNEKYLAKISNINDLETISILLFCSNTSITKNSIWKPLIITNKNRQFYTNLFNTISNNISKYRDYKYNYLLFDYLKVPKDDQYFGDRAYHGDFLSSLRKAYKEISEGKTVKRLKYFTFHKNYEYPKEFLQFVEHCYNKSQLINNFPGKNDDKDYIIKFPLRLDGYEGIYVTKNTFEFCKNLIEILKDIKNNYKIEDHEKLIFEHLSNISDVPLPLKYLNSIILIVRNKYDYWYQLKR